MPRTPPKPLSDKQLTEFQSGKFSGLVKRLADELAEARRVITPDTKQLESTLAQLRSENKNLRNQLERVNTEPSVTPLPVKAERTREEFDAKECCPRCRSRKKVSRLGTYRICLRKECGGIYWDNAETKPEPNNAIPF